MTTPGTADDRRDKPGTVGWARTRPRVAPRVLATAVEKRFTRMQRQTVAHALGDVPWPAGSPYTPTLLGAAQILERAAADGCADPELVAAHLDAIEQAQRQHSEARGLFAEARQMVKRLRAGTSRPGSDEDTALQTLAVEIVEARPALWKTGTGRVAWTAATDEMLAGLRIWNRQGLLSQPQQHSKLLETLNSGQPRAPRQRLHPAERRALRVAWMETPWGAVTVKDAVATSMAGIILALLIGAVVASRDSESGSVFMFASATVAALVWLFLVAAGPEVPRRVYGDPRRGATRLSNATVADAAAEFLAGNTAGGPEAVERASAIRDGLEALNLKWLRYTLNAEEMLQVMPRLRDPDWSATKTYREAMKGLRTAVSGLGDNPLHPQLDQAEHALSAARDAWTVACIAAAEDGVQTLPSSERALLRGISEHLAVVADESAADIDRAEHLQQLRDDLKKLKRVPITHEQLLALPQMESIRRLAMEPMVEDGRPTAGVSPALPPIPRAAGFRRERRG